MAMQKSRRQRTTKRSSRKRGRVSGKPVKPNFSGGRVR